MRSLLFPILDEWLALYISSVGIFLILAGGIRLTPGAAAIPAARPPAIANRKHRRWRKSAEDQLREFGAVLLYLSSGGTLESMICFVMHLRSRITATDSRRCDRYYHNVRHHAQKVVHASTRPPRRFMQSPKGEAKSTHTRRYQLIVIPAKHVFSDIRRRMVQNQT